LCSKEACLFLPPTNGFRWWGSSPLAKLQIISSVRALDSFPPCGGCDCGQSPLGVTAMTTFHFNFIMIGISGCSCSNEREGENGLDIHRQSFNHSVYLMRRRCHDADLTRLNANTDECNTVPTLWFCSPLRLTAHRMVPREDDTLPSKLGLGLSSRSSPRNQHASTRFWKNNIGHHIVILEYHIQHVIQVFFRRSSWYTG
jgi:hypothetical protein